MATGACDIGAEGVPAVLDQRSRAERDKGLCWAPSPILLQTRLPAPIPRPAPTWNCWNWEGGGQFPVALNCVFLHRHNYGLFAIARVLRGLAHFSGADAKSILQTIDDVHETPAHANAAPVCTCAHAVFG